METKLKKVPWFQLKVLRLYSNFKFFCSDSNSNHTNGHLARSDYAKRRRHGREWNLFYLRPNFSHFEDFLEISPVVVFNDTKVDRQMKVRHLSARLNLRFKWPVSWSYGIHCCRREISRWASLQAPFSNTRQLFSLKNQLRTLNNDSSPLRWLSLNSRNHSKQFSRPSHSRLRRLKFL